MQRWGIFLSVYSYDIEYKDTKLYANADSLSHLPVQGEEVQDTAATAETKTHGVLSQVYQFVLEG